ncbi:MAG: hypothetical protein QM831_17030 [Kofleriaceae bacterium]
MSLSESVGKQITVEGTARNAAAGAVIMTGDGPIYLQGIESWDKATDGKQVSVTGTLRAQDNGSLVNDKGEYSHGIPGKKYELASATWKPA